MAYEDLDTGGSIYNDQATSTYNYSQPDFSSHFNQGTNSALLSTYVTNNMSETLRSFKDTMAFSFQTLNLTLSSLSNTLNTLSSKITIGGGLGGNQQSSVPMYYNRVGSYNNMFPGSVPNNYLNMTASGNMPRLSMFREQVPGNIGPMQFYYNRSREEPFEYANGIINWGVNSSLGVVDTAFSWGVPMMMGGGLAGGVAGAVIGGLPGMLAGAAIRPFAEDAIVHNKDVFNVQNMSTRFSNRFSTREAQRYVRGMENLAYNELMTNGAQDIHIGTQGYRDITSMGLQANLFNGSSPEELTKQVASAAKTVKFLLDVTGSDDVKSTMQMLKQMKDMGVNLAKDPSFAQRLGNNIFKYSTITGIQPEQLLSMASNISVGSYGAFRNPAFVGVEGGIRNIAFLRELEKRNMMTPAEIAASGGPEAMATRQSQFRAGMLNSGLGTAMLYSAATPGGGFNSAMFNNNIKGNIFNMASAASANFYGQGINGMVDFMMNKSNLIANFGKDGKLDERMDQVLFSFVQKSPIYRQAKTTTDRINAAGFVLMNIAPQFGAELTPEDAKAMARRMVQPSIATTLDRMGDRELAISEYSKTRSQYTVGAQFSRVGTAWERFKGSIYEGIASTTRGWADELTAGVTDTVGPESYYAISDSTRANTFGLSKLSGNLYKEYNKGQARRIANATNINDLRREEALDYNSLFKINDYDRIGEALAYDKEVANGFSPIKALKGSHFFSGNLEAVASVLRGNSNANYKHLAEEAIDPTKSKSSAYYFSQSSLVDNNDDYNAFKKYMLDNNYFGDLKYEDIVSRTASYVRNGSKKDYIDSVLKQDTGVTASDVADALRSIGGKITVSSDVVDGKIQHKIKSFTANQFMHQWGSNVDSKERKAILNLAINRGLVKEGASKTDQDKAIAKVIASVTGEEDNDVAAVIAAYGSDELNNLAKGGFVLNKAAIKGGLGTMRNEFSTNTISAQIANMTGVTGDFLNSEVDKYGSDAVTEDMQTMRKAIIELGNDGKISKDTFSKFKSDSMREKASSLTRDRLFNTAHSIRDKNGTQIFTNLLWKDVDPRTGKSMSLSEKDWDKMGDIFMGATHYGLDKANIQSLMDNAGLMGLKLSEKEASDIISGASGGSGFKKLSEHIRRSGNKQANQDLDYVLKMSDEELTKNTGVKVTSDNKQDLQFRLLMNATGALSKDRERENNENRGKVESAIDSAVERVGNVSFVLVKQVDKDIDSIRQEVKDSQNKSNEDAQKSADKAKEQAQKDKEMFTDDNY